MKPIIFFLILVSMLLVAGCANNLSVIGSYVDVNNHICLQILPNGSFLVRSLVSPIPIQAHYLQGQYQIKNNFIIMPYRLPSGELSNGGLICNITGSVLDCGNGGVYTKTDSCGPIPTPIIDNACGNVSFKKFQPDVNHVTFEFNFQDPCGKTTDVVYNIYKTDTWALLYSKDFGNPGTNLITADYTVDYSVSNISEQGYFFNYSETRNNQTDSTGWEGPPR